MATNDTATTRHPQTRVGHSHLTVAEGCFQKGPPENYQSKDLTPF